MVANDGEMSVWSYTHFTLINKHFTPIHEHFNITSLKQTIIRSYDSTDCMTVSAMTVSMVLVYLLYLLEWIANWN